MLTHMSTAEQKLLPVTYTNQQEAGFMQTVRKRVDQYFIKTKKSKRCNAHMIAKTLFFAGGWAALYAVILFGGLGEWTMLGLSMVLGAFLTGIGFNIGHDAIHGAYAKSTRLNKIASLSFECIGASAYTWKIRHNILHHTHTNIIGSDGDLESMPLLRFCLKPGRKKIHAYQHWYALFLYCFVTLVWVFKKDFKHILEERRDQRMHKKPPVRVYVSLIAFKLLHYTLFLVVPYMVLQIAFWKILIGFLAMHFVAGFLMATIFQLAHLVEGPKILDFPEDGIAKDSWAKHQLQTTSNFGSHFLTTFFCGGLNYQVEHHLFPTICHVHYPAIYKIVKQTAQEFDLPYHEQPNIFAALVSHLRTLKYLGRNDPRPQTASG